MSKHQVDEITDLAGTGAPSFPNGVSLDPANMSDADATRLGLRLYTEADVTLAVSPAGWSTDYIHLRPYQMHDGSWRLTFNIRGTFTPTTSYSLEITGLSFSKNQAVTTYGNSSSASYRGIAGATPNQILIQTDVSLSSNAISGDIIIDSKPTWAV